MSVSAAHLCYSLPTRHPLTAAADTSRGPVYLAQLCDLAGRLRQPVGVRHYRGRATVELDVKYRDEHLDYSIPAEAAAKISIIVSRHMCVREDNDNSDGDHDDGDHDGIIIIATMTMMAIIIMVLLETQDGYTQEFNDPHVCDMGLSSRRVVRIPSVRPAISVPTRVPHHRVRRLRQHCPRLWHVKEQEERAVSKSGRGSSRRRRRRKRSRCSRSRSRISRSSKKEQQKQEQQEQQEY